VEDDYMGKMAVGRLDRACSAGVQAFFNGLTIGGLAFPICPLGWVPALLACGVVRYSPEGRRTLFKPS